MILWRPTRPFRTNTQKRCLGLEADCSSDHELLIAKFRLKLKKIGKTTRPFRYDLNQIPYDYTMEVRNIFKGLECKSRKSRNTWSNRKFDFGVRNEARHRLIEFCQENALVITNTLFQQHRRRLYTWTSPDGQHQNDWLYSLQPKMEKVYTVSKNKTRSWLLLRSWTPYYQIQT